MPSGFLVLLLLSGANPVGSDDCPAIVAATTSENVDRNPDAVRCLTSRMSQKVYEDTERCIELMIGVSDLRESLKGIERYSHLDNAKSDRIEARMRGEFARMRALPPLGVDLDAGRQVAEATRAPFAVALSSIPDRRYAVWYAKAVPPEHCTAALEFRTALRVLEEDERRRALAR